MSSTATLGSPSGQEDTSLPGRPSDASKPTIVIQQNRFEEAVTININSNNSYGATVTKLEHVTAQPAEPTSLQRPLTRQLALVEYGGESVVLNGNTFNEYVTLNIGSPYSTGAVKQTALPSPSRTKTRTRSRTKNRAKSGGRMRFGDDDEI
ncbi:hypothetical protein EDB19DRAFT_1312285 [Suillus lakei]|nr:hypothetical protein EDB19DRAFT_1312285 [Suillus lakei]